MTDFIDGYTPGKFTAETSITTTMDPIKVTFAAEDSSAGDPDAVQALYDAIAAAQTAVKASLEASYTGRTAYPGAIRLEGGKAL